MVAEETCRAVQAEETKALEKASFAGAIAADAQRDLDEALPALDAALASLKSLNKNDVVEVSFDPAMMLRQVFLKTPLHCECIQYLQ